MKEITLEARVDNIPAATAWLDGELEALGCPMKAQMQLDVALDEIFSNIARYAYNPGTGEATLRLNGGEDGTVSLTFIDRGTPYNPLENPDPDTSLAASERGIGGLGIFVVKKTMDEVSYRHEDGQNMLTLRKKLR